MKIKAEKIQKEQVRKFRQVPVSPDTHVTPLKSKLELALKLGNTFNGKCNLIFHTTAGNKKVHTSIWNVTDEHIELKGGETLLISSIVDIQ